MRFIQYIIKKWSNKQYICYIFIIIVGAKTTKKLLIKNWLKKIQCIFIKIAAGGLYYIVLTKSNQGET